jgi:hypothetical protein
MNAAPRSNFGSPQIAEMVSANVGAAAAATGSFLTSWVGVLVVLLALVVLFAVYYQTIGYYIQIGWKKLDWSHDRGERIDIQVPGADVVAHLAPAAPPPAAGGPSSIIGGMEAATRRLETDVEAALSGMTGGGAQVFNVARNLYSYAEAEPLCRAFGAELATYDQVKDAWAGGADWCNYGWVKGQLAVYPTQQATYDKLQGGPADQRGSCGIPGVNGGYFPNAEQRFGVNCYGPRPTESPLDERQQYIAQHETAFDKEVARFKAELPGIAVNPWNGAQWSA